MLCSFFEKIWLFLVFIEENAFKHFLYVNITKFRLFLFFSYDTDHAQTSTSENGKSFKDYDVYLIITISHTLRSSHLQACSLIKKETLAQVFSYEFYEISKNTFFYRTPLGDCFFTLNRNLTTLLYVRKEKNPKLKIFISSLFQGKSFVCKFKYGFAITLCTKAIFFDFKKKSYFETLSK